MENLDRNMTGIMNQLIQTADLICFDNTKDFMDTNEANANVVRFCLAQQDDSRPDLGITAILKEHGLARRHLNFLILEGVMSDHNSTDAHGCCIDDRCLHVQLNLADVRQHATLNQANW